MTPERRLIGVYELVGDFHQSDGGNCKVAAAVYEGKRFFIKQFLSPKYPSDSAPGMPAKIAKRRAEFLEFERRQNQKLKAVKKVAMEGGRVVVPVQQFRQDTFWYTVAPWVDTAGLAVAEIAALPLGARLVILTTVALAVRALHAAGIVHGDLKPGNILITRAAAGGFHANLIDFDSSYLEADPPGLELMKGDQPYYSPELLSYLQEDVGPSALTKKSDVFALGIVFCEYLTGQRPGIEGYAYACEAVRAGVVPHIPASIGDPRLLALLAEMLLADPGARPAMTQIIKQVKDINRVPSPAEPPPEPATADSRIKRGKTRADTKPPVEPPPLSTETAGTSRIKVRSRRRPESD